MDLSYEETIRRIDEYEKNDPTNYKYCREKKYPHYIDLYKGENQIIVSPLITSIGWYSTPMAWYRTITDMQNPNLIGEMILQAFAHIENSPVDARTKAEREEDSFMKHAVSFKSYRAFNRNYILCCVILHEDGTYIVSQTEKLKGNKGYGGTDESLIHLEPTASAEK